MSQINKTGGTTGSNQYGPRGIAKQRDPSTGTVIDQPDLMDQAASRGNGLPISDETRALQTAISANQPVILWGMPGEGKTSTIEDLADAMGAHAEVLIGSQYEPSDIAGQPWVQDGQIEHLPPAWARRIAELDPNTPSVLFFDELDKCPPAVQAACLRVIRERVVADTRLPENCSVVAAANPPELGGWDLSAPMANRFIHLDWQLDSQTAIQGLSSGSWPRANRQEVEPEALAAATANWRGLVGAFLQTRPQLVRNMPTDETHQGRAWPSPRSWEMLIHAGAQAEASGQPPVVQSMIINGTIGQGAGAEFSSWRDSMDLPNPEDVLRDPASVEIPARSDKVMATATAVIAAVNANMNQERIDKSLAYLDRVCKAGRGDAALPAIRAYAGIVLSGNAPWALPDEDKMKSIMQLLKDAGQ